jgi:hypothetical protein
MILSENSIYKFNIVLNFVSVREYEYFLYSKMFAILETIHLNSLFISFCIYMNSKNVEIV